jgi:pimeloyl-ACP methyl ester carboxylesterase
VSAHADLVGLEHGSVTANGMRDRPRLLCGGAHAQRVPRRAELVPQHRPAARLRGALVDAILGQPSRYLAGSTDLIAGNTPGAIATMQSTCADPRRCELLDGAGHWIQQERPDEVNAALVDFLQDLEQ